MEGQKKERNRKRKKYHADIEIEQYCCTNSLSGLVELP
jgi:hypothetical protein